MKTKLKTAGTSLSRGTFLSLSDLYVLLLKYAYGKSEGFVSVCNHQVSPHQT